MNHPGIFRLDELMADPIREEEALAVLDDLYERDSGYPKKRMSQIIRKRFTHVSPTLQLRTLELLDYEDFDSFSYDWIDFFTGLLNQPIDYDVRTKIASVIDSTHLTEEQVDRLALLLLAKDIRIQQVAFATLNTNMESVSIETRLILAETLAQHSDPQSTYIYELLLTNGDDDLIEKHLQLGE